MKLENAYKPENTYKNVCGNDAVPGMNPQPYQMPYPYPYPHKEIDEKSPQYGYKYTIERMEQKLFELKCKCTHMCKGRFVAQPIGDEKYRCNICGEEFKILDKENLDDIIKACETISYALQTIKVLKAAYANSTDEKLEEVLAVINQIPRTFQETIDMADKSLEQTIGRHYENNFIAVTNHIGPGVPCPKWMCSNEEEE